MRFIGTRLLCCIALVFGSVSVGQAQVNLPGFLQNFEIGYGYSLTWADYAKTFRAVDVNGKGYDTTVTKNVKSVGGFSYQVGTSINLKRLGEKSQLALGIMGGYNIYGWDFGVANNVRLSDTGAIFDYSQGTTFDGITMNAGMALSADFKFGAEAMMDKQYRLSWIGGFGILPSINLTSSIDDAQMSFGVQPFVKSEFGIRGPIAAKIRLLYAFGKLDYLSLTDRNNVFGIPGAENDTKLTGKGNFTVSIILLPFSWAYKHSQWYNSY